MTFYRCVKLIFNYELFQKDYFGRRFLQPAVLLLLFGIFCYPVIQVIHFIHAWPKLSDFSYNTYLNAVNNRNLGSIPIFMPVWLIYIREISMLVVIFLPPWIVCHLWARDKDRSNREAIALTTIKPSHLLLSRSVFWVAFPFIWFFLHFAEEFLERIFVSLFASDDSVLHYAYVHGCFFGVDPENPMARDKVLGKVLKHWVEDGFCLAFMVCGIWSSWIGLCTRLSLRCFEVWKSYIIATLIIFSPLLFFALWEYYSNPLYYYNLSFRTSYLLQDKLLLFPSIFIFIPFTFFVWRGANKRIAYAYYMEIET